MSTEDEQDEEQVVGVLQPCEVCEAKTVHVGGVCRDHQVVRRRKVAPAGVAPSRAPAAAAGPAAAATPVRRVKKRPPPPPPPRRWRYVLGLIVVAGLVVGAGFMHIVRGSDISVHVCEKYGWSLSDTYVNLDDYHVGGEPMSLKLEAALKQCELLY